MTDYRALITPYLESIRTERTTPQTIKKYTERLNMCIVFLEETGRDAPDDAYYEALENRLQTGNLAASQKGFAPSTTAGIVKLAFKFFKWTQKGQIQMPIENKDIFTAETNEKAPPLILDGGQDETGEDDTPAPPPSPVDEVQEPPQEEEQELSQSTGHAKPPKITIYPDKELEEDIKDLARLSALPVSKFILNLIRHEVENSKEDLKLLRRLRAKRV